MENFLKISGVVCSVEVEIVWNCTKWGVKAVSRLYVEMMAYMYICMCSSHRALSNGHIAVGVARQKGRGIATNLQKRPIVGCVYVLVEFWMLFQMTLKPRKSDKKWAWLSYKSVKRLKIRSMPV